MNSRTRASFYKKFNYGINYEISIIMKLWKKYENLPYLYL